MSKADAANLISIDEDFDEQSHPSSPTAQISVIVPVKRKRGRPPKRKIQEPVIVTIDSSDDDTEDNDTTSVYCFCKKKRVGAFMITCESCENWFHGSCVNITKEMGKNLAWNCLECLKKQENSAVVESIESIEIINSSKKIEEKPAPPVIPAVDVAKAATTSTATVTTKTKERASKRSKKSTDDSKAAAAASVPDEDVLDQVRSRVVQGIAKVLETGYKTLFELMNKLEEEKYEISEDVDIQSVAQQIEDAMKKSLSGDAYREKFRTLHYNLKDYKNVFNILSGNITPERLVTMKSEDLADEQLKSMKEDVQKQSLQNSVVTEEMASILLKKTHKGETRAGKKPHSITVTQDPMESMIVLPSSVPPEYCPNSLQVPIIGEKVEMDLTEDANDHEPSSITSAEKLKEPSPMLSHTKSPESSHSNSPSINSLSRSSSLDALLAKVTADNVTVVPVSATETTFHQAPEVAKDVAPEPTRPCWPGVKFLSDLPQVWEGVLDQFDVTCKQIGGSPLNGKLKWQHLLSSPLMMAGRITHDSVNTYIDQLSPEFRKVAIVVFEPADSIAYERYKIFWHHYHSKQRYAVVKPAFPRVKDVYMVPLPKNAPLPIFMISLDHNIPPSQREIDLLLGVVVYIPDIKPTRDHLSISSSLPSPMINEAFSAINNLSGLIPQNPISLIPRPNLMSKYPSYSYTTVPTHRLTKSPAPLPQKRSYESETFEHPLRKRERPFSVAPPSSDDYRRLNEDRRTSPRNESRRSSSHHKERFIAREDEWGNDTRSNYSNDSKTIGKSKSRYDSQSHFHKSERARDPRRERTPEHSNQLEDSRSCSAKSEWTHQHADEWLSSTQANENNFDQSWGVNAQSESNGNSVGWAMETPKRSEDGWSSKSQGKPDENLNSWSQSPSKPLSNEGSWSSDAKNVPNNSKNVWSSRNKDFSHEKALEESKSNNYKSVSNDVNHVRPNGRDYFRDERRDSPRSNSSDRKRPNNYKRERSISVGKIDKHVRPSFAENTFNEKSGDSYNLITSESVDSANAWGISTTNTFNEDQSGWMSNTARKETPQDPWGNFKILESSDYNSSLNTDRVDKSQGEWNSKSVQENSSQDTHLKNSAKISPIKSMSDFVNSDDTWGIKPTNIPHEDSCGWAINSTVDKSSEDGWGNLTLYSDISNKKEKILKIDEIRSFAIESSHAQKKHMLKIISQSDVSLPTIIPKSQTDESWPTENISVQQSNNYKDLSSPVRQTALEDSRSGTEAKTEFEDSWHREPSTKPEDSWLLKKTIYEDPWSKELTRLPEMIGSDAGNLCSGNNNAVNSWCKKESGLPQVEKDSWSKSDNKIETDNSWFNQKKSVPHLKSDSWSNNTPKAKTNEDSWSRAEVNAWSKTAEQEDSWPRNTKTTKSNYSSSRAEARIKRARRNHRADPRKAQPRKEMDMRNEPLVNEELNYMKKQDRVDINYDG